MKFWQNVPSEWESTKFEHKKGSEEWGKTKNIELYNSLTLQIDLVGWQLGSHWKLPVTRTASCYQFLIKQNCTSNWCLSTDYLWLLLLTFDYFLNRATWGMEKKSRDKMCETEDSNQSTPWMNIQIISSSMLFSCTRLNDDNAYYHQLIWLIWWMLWCYCNGIELNLVTNMHLVITIVSILTSYVSPSIILLLSRGKLLPHRRLFLSSKVQKRSNSLY